MPRKACSSSYATIHIAKYKNETNKNMEDSACQSILSKETSRLNSLCFTKNDVLVVSTLLGEFILIQ